ncbi:uncharacterized protein CTRU02_212943 [Colletotrichum truncatum]|uniref:Uncharacterized protein n=1 Tax=Colletotrichum truncatum TaxID=5467 RepID=A0ACC3YJB2_COLTU|nr:uncharacterized protein CTRU02_03266 [Colletotrichum truncatum]KAF6797235.1 hypothetical protein CTRU02_03266 [Colletotrichum truncatum]
MVTTRNMTRSGVESPAENTTPKKLPVRGKDGKGTPKSTPKATPKKGSAKKDESSRPSSKKKSSLAVELRAESTPSKSTDLQGQTVITGPEQPAPEPELEDKVIDDSEASPQSGNDAKDEEATKEEEPAAPAEEKKAPAAEQADDSDSDEAPEAVSTSKAAVQAKKSAQAATKAIAEQAAAQKRKRQERNVRLQEQAAVRKAQETAAAEEQAKKDKEEKEEEEEKPQAAAEKPGRRRLDKFDLPAELPAEFLNSDSEDDGEGADDERKPRKVRKLSAVEAQIARESRGPKDEVVGTTVFRVAKKEDERMTPRAQKYSVNAKKALLARGRTPVKARKGFFV